MRPRDAFKLFAFAICAGAGFGLLRGLLLPDLSLGWALLLAVVVGAIVGGAAVLWEQRRRARS